MANHVEHIDAFCRVKSVQAILSLWLEAPLAAQDIDIDLVGGMLSLLEGVPEAIESAEAELAKLEIVNKRQCGEVNK